MTTRTEADPVFQRDRYIGWILPHPGAKDDVRATCLACDHFILTHFNILVTHR